MGLLISVGLGRPDTRRAATRQTVVCPQSSTTSNTMYRLHGLSRPHPRQNPGNPLPLCGGPGLGTQLPTSPARSPCLLAPSTGDPAGQWHHGEPHISNTHLESCRIFIYLIHSDIVHMNQKGRYLLLDPLLVCKCVQNGA